MVQRRIAALPGLAAALAVGLGLATLTGWAIDNDILKSGGPGLVTMKANTAVCLVLTGLSLALLRHPGARRWDRVVGRALALVVGTVGALTLVEWIFGVDLGIDRLLFEEAAGAATTSVPGRMAENTAIVLCLFSIALLTLDRPGRGQGWVASGAAIAGGVIAVATLAGYLLGATSLYPVSRDAQMAVTTAVAFTVLSLGVVCARTDTGLVRLIGSDTVGGTLIRVLLPTAFLVPLALGAVRLVGEGAGFYGAETGEWLFAMAVIAMLVPLTWNLAASVDRAERAFRTMYAARRQAQRERAAFDESPIGCALVSADGRYERVNRAFLEMTGYTSAELVGRCFLEVTHPDDRAANAEAMDGMLRGAGRSHETVKRYVHRSGRIIEARVDVATILDEEGKVDQFFSQIQDITEGRRIARQLEEAQFETLARLAAAAELRDDETGEHTRRVGELAARLAEQLGLSPEDQRLIRFAAPLHDVGKIGIPDGILLKPGRLTPDEFEQIKAHTTLGAQMLSGGAFALLAKAEEIAISHHERWEGGGYPRELTGEKIPISGRIVAVADVFDALTHDRPYKQAWTREAAIEEIAAQRGRHFDPDVVDGFLAVIAENRTGRFRSQLAARPVGR
jgi:PAS domain S-box-containing protein/putative nucleotidyltransferase with HDIG domain